jgi:hypothetical protein
MRPRRKIQKGTRDTNQSAQFVGTCCKYFTNFETAICRHHLLRVNLRFRQSDHIIKKIIAFSMRPCLAHLGVEPPTLVVLIHPKSCFHILLILFGQLWRVTLAFKIYPSLSTNEIGGAIFNVRLATCISVCPTCNR